MTATAKVEVEPISRQSLRVWLKLLKASSTIETILRRKLREEHKTTLPRFDVMSALARHPEGMKMSAVSDLLRVSNGNVTSIVDRLVEDGLVERRAIPGDRRAVEVGLTKQGRKIFNEHALEHETWIDELLSGLGRENLEAHGEMLEALNRHLENSGSKE